MGRALPWLLLLVCAVSGGVVWVARAREAAPDPGSSYSPRPGLEIVRKAWTVGREVPLQGRQVVLVSGPQGRVQLEAEVVAAGDGRMRIEYQTEPLRKVTVWEDRDRTYRFNPELKKLTVAIRRVGQQSDLHFLESHRAQVVGEETIAGRPALVVELRPKSGDRWKKLWIDSERWVTLCTEDRDAAGRVLRRTAFTQVRYLSPDEAPDPAVFRPNEALLARYGSAEPGDSSSRFTPAELEPLVGFRVLIPAWLPSGFRLEGGYLTPGFCQGSGQGVRLEYTDGLSMLTLFQCRSPRCPGREEDAAGTAGAVYRRVGDVHALGIGELPQSQLRRVLESLG